MNEQAAQLPTMSCDLLFLTFLSNDFLWRLLSILQIFQTLAVAKVIWAAVRTVSTIAEPITVAKCSQDRNTARVVSSLTATLFVVPGAAVISRYCPIRAWPSRSLTVYEIG